MGGHLGGIERIDQAVHFFTTRDDAQRVVGQRMFAI
jgi:hypothetical protein